LVTGNYMHVAQKSRSEMPLECRLYLAEDLLEALEYLHRHGVVHGDIKPESVYYMQGVQKSNQCMVRGYLAEFSLASRLPKYLGGYADYHSSGNISTKSKNWNTTLYGDELDREEELDYEDDIEKLTVQLRVRPANDKTMDGTHDYWPPSYNESECKTRRKKCAEFRLLAEFYSTAKTIKELLLPLRPEYAKEHGVVLGDTIEKRLYNQIIAFLDTILYSEHRRDKVLADMTAFNMLTNFRGILHSILAEDSSHTFFHTRGQVARPSINASVLDTLHRESSFCT